MTFEEINKTIEVIAYFDALCVRPLRFRWEGRAYRVSQINHTWNILKGKAREYYFHVSTKESNNFELVYNNDNLEWKISRAYLD